MVALVSLLFTQLALAGYDCPQLALPQQAPMSMPDGPMEQGACVAPHAGQSANLCDAHGQSSAQSLDFTAQPHVAPFMPAALVVSLSSVDVALPSNLDAPPAFMDSAGSSPPLSIRHCCLRN